MRLPSTRFWPLLVTTLLVHSACGPSGDIEPVPSPGTEPENLQFSTLGAENGWVSVVGEAGSVLPDVSVRLENEASGAAGEATAAADGSFAAAVPATRGDRLRLAAEGYKAVVRAAEAPAPTAPPAPGSDVATVGVRGPTDGGRYWISCGAGCLPAGGGLVAYAASPRRGTLARSDVDASGAFALRVDGAAGDPVFVFAARGRAVGPETTVSLPAGVDGDGDGFDASVDCDDDERATRPGADENCNGKDDNCDGEIDEGCGGPSPDSDGDGVPNSEDGCPNVADPTQADFDDDGRGDACDNDADDDRSPSTQDCDDLDPRRGHNFPESCGDGADNDCDGATDEDC